MYLRTTGSMKLDRVPLKEYLMSVLHSCEMNDWNVAGMVSEYIIYLESKVNMIRFERFFLRVSKHSPNQKQTWKNPSPKLFQATYKML